MSGLQRIYRRNPLAYPGRAPGFDPSHLVASNTMLSAVAAGANFVNCLNGSNGTVVAGSTPVLPSGGLYGALGPAVNFSLATNPVGKTSYVSFPGSSTNVRTVTIGALLYFLVNGAQAVGVVANDSNGSGVSFRVNNSGTFTLQLAGVASYNSSAVTLNAAGFYFVAASVNTLTGAYCFVLLNLLTGQTTYEALSGSAHTPGSPTGSFVVGNYGNAAAPASEMNGAIAAVAYINGYRPLPQLLAWAADPWSFWYPPTVENLIFNSLKAPSASSFLAAWALGRNVVNGGMAT
jgi:hypothetical protein